MWLVDDQSASHLRPYAYTTVIMQVAEACATYCSNATHIKLFKPQNAIP